MRRKMGEGKQSLLRLPLVVALLDKVLNGRATIADACAALANTPRGLTILLNARRRERGLPIPGSTSRVQVLEEEIAHLRKELNRLQPHPGDHSGTR